MHSSSHILVIERRPSPGLSLAPSLRDEGFQVIDESCVDRAANHLQAIDLAVLNAVSLGTSGARLARRLAHILANTPIILLSPADHPPAYDGVASAVLVEPFTSRKVINRILQFLPPEEDQELRAGPLHLNPASRILRSYGRRTRLTPKLFALLHYLIRRRGRLVRREDLMRQVWQTNYTGDMRTIDVHIAWLRNAIEEDPTSPRLLRTIRGMGYRLDLPLP
jgi:DNA-binding response OmpR family regulator